MIYDNIDEKTDYSKKHHQPHADRPTGIFYKIGEKRKYTGISSI